MNKETQPTPTPWNLSPRITTPEGKPQRLIQAKGTCIAKLDCAYHGQAEDTANAEFIVRAVNSHEKLLRLAKRQERWIANAWALLTPDQRCFCSPFFDPAIAAPIIAQAEGK